MDLNILKLICAPVSGYFIKNVCKKNLISFTYTDFQIFGLNIRFDTNWSFLIEFVYEKHLASDNTVSTFDYLINLKLLKLYQRVYLSNEEVVVFKRLVNLKNYHICKKQFGTWHIG